ncbi:MAG: HlyD family type I secretion periplasmic adaptor subunit [Pseudomonadota bacterium]
MVTKTDTDFMEELEAATRTRPSLTSNAMLIAISTFVILAFVWASQSEIEELTRGGGQVVPSQEVQVVQSLEGGILAELLVEDGEIVEKDQILLRISDVVFASEERGTEIQFLALQAKRTRLQAEANGEELNMLAEIQEKAPEVANNEIALYKSRQQELNNAKSILDSRISKAQAELAEVKAKISRLADSRALLRQELAITQEMVRQRAVPKLEEIRLNREINDLSGQISESKQQQTGLDAELSGARKERQDQEDKFRSQALGELSEVETQIAQLQESLTAIGDRVFRTELRSPVRGIVNKISLKTIGGVIEPAMRLVEIVPLDDSLKIIARVSPQDIAFLHPGQDVNVKVTAYDPQKFGSLPGKLVRLGANSVTDREENVFFEIEVRTDKNYMGNEDKPLPITPGMVAEVEVITGKRTILEYLAKPILRARDRALTER